MPVGQLRLTVVDKLKMNGDHSMIAFTVDIGNSEKATAGLKDMKSGRVVPDFKLENVSQVEFFGQEFVDGEAEDVLFFVEMNSHNRPYKVKKITTKTR